MDRDRGLWCKTCAKFMDGNFVKTPLHIKQCLYVQVVLQVMFLLWIELFLLVTNYKIYILTGSGHLYKGHIRLSNATK